MWKPAALMLLHASVFPAYTAYSGSSGSSVPVPRSTQRKIIDTELTMFIQCGPPPLTLHP